MHLFGLTLIAGSLALAASCSPYTPDLGEMPFRCGTADPKCPDDYSCDLSGGGQGVCVREGSGVADAGPDAMTIADAGPLVCNNDSAIEPNNNIGTATTTPIPDQANTYTLVGLSICPAGDVDVFRFRIDVNGTNIRATASETVRARGDLVVEILNGTGVPIATGEYNGTNTSITASVNNAPTGTYFIQVRGLDTTTQNNYNRIFIETTP